MKYIIPLLAVICNAQDFAQMEKALKANNLKMRQKALTGLFWLPHLPVNDDFRSTIQIRNDDPDLELTVNLFFRNQGDATLATFRDQDGIQRTDALWEATIEPLGIAEIQLLALAGGARSTYAAVFTLSSVEPVIGTDRVAIESSYSWMTGGQVKSIAAAAATKGTEAFKANIDRMPTVWSSEPKFRGLAFLNTNLDLSCDCVIFLVDSDGSAVDLFETTIPPNEKWLGLITDLFPSLDLLISNGQGHVFAFCDQEVSATVLTFQGNALGAAPVTRFQ